MKRKSSKKTSDTTDFNINFWPDTEEKEGELAWMIQEAEPAKKKKRRSKKKNNN